MGVLDPSRFRPDDLLTYRVLTTLFHGAPTEEGGEEGGGGGGAREPRFALSIVLFLFNNRVLNVKVSGV